MGGEGERQGWVDTKGDGGGEGGGWHERSEEEEWSTAGCPLPTLPS